MRKYIISDPNILNGKPVIAGTRIPVSQILFLLKEGYTVKEVHEEYPNVPVNTLQHVIEELTVRLERDHHGSPLPQI